MWKEHKNDITKEKNNHLEVYKCAFTYLNATYCAHIVVFCTTPLLRGTQKPPEAPSNAVALVPQSPSWLPWACREQTHGIPHPPSVTSVAHAMIVSMLERSYSPLKLLVRTYYVHLGLHHHSFLLFRSSWYVIYHAPTSWCEEPCPPRLLLAKAHG